MIPPLPTEILHHITKLSLPVVSFGTYRQRYDLLLAYSLVNSTWRALAKRELYEELFARDSDRVAAALSVEGAREMVKRVHLGLEECQANSEDFSDAELGKWEMPVTAKELRISSLRIVTEDLPSFSQVETLHLRWVDFGHPPSIVVLPLPTSPPATMRFASLSILSLVGFYLFANSFPTWTQWFTPTTFPLLRRLSVAFISGLEDLGEDEDFRRALSSLAPQLTAFSLAQGGSELGNEDDFPWSKFTALQQLALHLSSWEPSDLLQAALANTPHSLSRLRIGAYGVAGVTEEDGKPWAHQVLEALTTAFVERAPSLRHLSVLSVEHLGDDMSEAVRQGVQTLHQEMGARGGSFEYRLGGEGQDDLLGERFFEPW